MGSSVIGTCSCGYETEAAVGGGMRNFKTSCYFPCLCESCRTVVSANLLAAAPACPQCQGRALVAYDEPGMSQAPGEHKIAQWNVKEQLGRELLLTDGKYLCPKCHQMTLQFRDSGVRWD